MHWLLSAAKEERTARQQWAEHGIALLSCGGIFSAVRIPGDLVRAAAGATRTEEVNAYLRQALNGGPVFVDTYSNLYYALVPSSTARCWNVRDLPGVECLGRDHYLGVPATDRTEPGGRSYWCVPMDSPGALCEPAAVVELVNNGQRRREAEEAGLWA